MAKKPGEQAASDPKTLTAWRRRRVIVRREIRNRSGRAFAAGDVVIVRRAYKDGTFDLHRPAVSINGVERDDFSLST